PINQAGEEATVETGLRGETGEGGVADVGGEQVCRERDGGDQVIPKIRRLEMQQLANAREDRQQARSAGRCHGCDGWLGLHQYFSGTNFRPFSVAWSSYSCFL